MNIALVNQPLGHILLPNPDRPLRSSSIGLWHYHVATRWEETDQVVVYGRSPKETRAADERHRGVRFQGIPVGFDTRCQKAGARLRAIRVRLGCEEDPRRPYFLSRLFYPSYILRVALDLRRSGCQVAHVANFSQFASILRLLVPRAKIFLHMHCEWLTHLDPALLDHHLRCCDRISACSRYLVEGMQRRFPQHAARCYSLPNGVDTDLFRPGEPPDPAKPEVLFVSRISPEKGVHVLVEAFARVLREVPGARLTLVGSQVPAPREFIVGVDPDPLVRSLERFYQDGPDGYLAYLRELSAPFAGRVTFLPRLPQSELLPIYRRAAVFVFPSVCQEAFGMPPAEAMACGVPVVAARSGGVPEVVEDGRTGLLVERGEVAGLARAIVALLRNPSQRQGMGAAGRARVLERFTWRQVARELRQRAVEAVAEMSAVWGKPVSGPPGGRS
jgi:glycosyltransferase involved in cell wall biosynthesis